MDAPPDPRRNCSTTISQFDLIIRIGTLVTHSDNVQTALANKGGQIAAIGQNPTGVQWLNEAGLLVFRGAVAPHRHLQFPRGLSSPIIDGSRWLRSGERAERRNSAACPVASTKVRPENRGATASRRSIRFPPARCTRAVTIRPTRGAG